MAVSKVLLLLSTMVVAGSSKNIVETAQGAADFSILVEALTQAKLVTALSGTGPFTVFAPTDAAFTAALTVLKLTKAELLARPDLADILKYHVLNGKILSTALVATQSPATLQGAKVTITKNAATVKFGRYGANVTSADLSCDNGVIHTIDAVILPPTIVQTAMLASPKFTKLVEALKITKLIDTLDGFGPFTVFAPTNDAFTAAQLMAGPMSAKATADLKATLQYHVLSGKILAADLKATQSPKTLQGSAVTIAKAGSSVTFGAAKVTEADIVCGNGVIHQIDKVVSPLASDATTTVAPTTTLGMAGNPVSSGAESKFSFIAFATGVAVMLATA